MNRKQVGVLLLLALVSGCSSGARRVSCEKHLVPINPSVPKFMIAAGETPKP
jgi:hypothetical protein